MPINETTTHLGLQLPHPSNSLEDDVLRLRSAINAVDAKFGELDTLLASDDASLNTVQEIVDVLKDNVAIVFDHVGEGGAAHAAATPSLAGFMSAADKGALDDHIGAGGDAHDAATESVDGFMSAADKAKLNDVTLGAVFDSVQITPTIGGQTAFTVTGGYAPGAIMVFLNGIKLLPADFTATTSPNLVLAVGAATVDTIEVVRFKQALAA